MSDIQEIAKLIDSAGSRVFYLRYTKKSGEESEGVFHAHVKYNLRGGEDSTKHIGFYKNPYNVQKKRWSKINLGNITEAKIDGKVYRFV